MSRAEVHLPHDRRPPGLTEADAAARLAADGPNALPGERERGLAHFVLRALKEPMLALLLVAAGAYGALGERAQAATLIGWVGALVALTVYQERRTEHAIAALRDLTSPRALVIRDGERRRVAGRDVVAGDHVLLEEGDRVPADGTLVDAAALSVDESMLTGESVPVLKRVGAGEAGQVQGGTLVVAGRGAATITRTGPRAAVGRIGAALATVTPPRTALQLEVDRLVRRLAVFGVTVSAGIAVAYGVQHHDAVAGLLAGISTAMALLPEELPVVLTIFLALGAWRLARQAVLTRRVAAIEALGAATVLCTDKTGTLTWNRMGIARVVVDGHRHETTGPLPEAARAVVAVGAEASVADAQDPIDRAFHALAGAPSAPPVHVYPLTPALLVTAHARGAPDTGWRIAAKGAPEAVAALCHTAGPERERALSEAAAMAADGLRVLAVADAALPPGSLPAALDALPLRWRGLTGLRDPVRDDVPAAVAAARGAGIRVVMITGDHPDTARAIAREAGIDAAHVVTGATLDAADDADLAARVRDTAVFARAVPSQKLRLVRALQAQGHVVAMTGDGVNDAPALKAADIGVAMGRRGTDVAREAAAIVLTDDAFPSIVDAVRAGRRIHDNIRKAMAFVLAVHVPIVGLSLVPVLLGRPLLFSPVHIVFLELLIDPACSIAFEVEPEEPDLLRRPPRAVTARMFDRRMALVALAQGATVLLTSLGALAWAQADGASEPAVRAAAFASLIAGNIGLIAVNRSWTGSVFGPGRPPNRPAAVVMAAAGVGVLVLLAIPATRALFGLAWPRPVVLVGSMAGAVVALGWFELVKVLRPAWLAERGAG